MVAGTHSGVGKTLVTMGLTAALKEKGRTIQVFKVGPDYIDSSHHRAISGRPCFNLDSWMLPPSKVGAQLIAPLQKIFNKGMSGADVGLIEGVMGLYDGFSGKSNEGSSAEIAKLLNVPVLLVLDGSALARSAAAIVHGFTQFDSELKFAGVLLNRVGGEGHAALLKEAIETVTKIPVIGFIPRDKTLEIPERHLGLVPAQEQGFQQAVDKMKELICRYCDLKNMSKITEISQAGSWELPPEADSPPVKEARSKYKSELSPSSQLLAPSAFKIRIAYAWDEAFHFYYQDNLDFLKELGAELVPFSPIHDHRLPDDIHALYFGGGFPEVFAKDLQSNIPMKETILLHSKQEIPLYAECGGLMYLSEGITDLEGNFYPMTGVIPGKIRMTDRLQNFGYQQARLIQPSWAGSNNAVFRAHEFHYSAWSGEGISPAHRVQGKNGAGDRTEGYLNSHILASYLHLHFLAVPERARCLIEAAKKCKMQSAHGTRS